MSLSMDDEARGLWQAWRAEMASDDSYVFTDQVEQLLSANRLEEVINHLAGLVEGSGDEEEMEEMVMQARGQAWATEVSDTQTAVLIALPTMGNVTQLAMDEPFWIQVHRHLQDQARKFLDNPKATLHLVPLEREVHSEAASSLTMDDGRLLLQELSQERPGAATQRLNECEDVMRGIELKIKSPGYVVVGHRVGLAALVVDDDTWGDMDTFTTFMAGLEDMASWTQKFVNADRLVMPPMTLVQALTENLGAHMARVVMDALIDREMTLPSDSFELNLHTLDTGHESNVVELAVYLDGTMLDPILIPSGWLATIGVEGFTKATDILKETIRHHAQTQTDLANADPENDEPVPPSAPRRRRLH